MPKLPTLTYKEVIKCFERLGYEVVRQKGSHIRLRHKINKNKKPLTIPAHETISKRAPT